MLRVPSRYCWSGDLILRCHEPASSTGGVWVLASLLTLPLIDPVMNQYVDRPSFFAAHIVYGLILGLWFTRAHKVHV